MLGNETLWDTAAHCHALLEKAAVSHAVIGGVAVCLHGYQRNTIDLDLLIPPDSAAAVRTALDAAGYRWSAKNAEFTAPSGIPVQFLTAGDRAGKGSEVRLPDPTDESTITYVEGLPVVTLARLIESKLACAEGNLRRTHKDLADVVELIAKHHLSPAFARKLHKSVQPAFRQLVKHARDEE